MGLFRWHWGWFPELQGCFQNGCMGAWLHADMPTWDMETGNGGLGLLLVMGLILHC